MPFPGNLVISECMYCDNRNVSTVEICFYTVYDSLALIVQLSVNYIIYA